MAKSIATEQAVAAVRPWVRYWARSFDFALYYLVMLAIVFPTVTASGWGLFFAPIYIAVMYAVFFLAAFIEAVMIVLWGTTPGKALLKIELRTDSGNRLSFGQALKRSGDLWFRGLALGIPVLNIVSLLIAFIKLKRNGETSWDRDNHLKVTHGPISWIRWIVALMVILALPVAEFVINLFFATVAAIVMGVLTLTAVVVVFLFQWLIEGVQAL